MINKKWDILLKDEMRKPYFMEKKKIANAQFENRKDGAEIFKFEEEVEKGEKGDGEETKN